MAVTAITLLFAALATSISLLLVTPSSSNRSLYHSHFTSSLSTANATIADHLRRLTLRPHVAGSAANADVAAYVHSTLSSCGVPSRIRSYGVLLTYPVSRSLSFRSESQPEAAPVQFKLQQEVFHGDPSSAFAGEVLPTFHAYAPSGSVIGPVVYVNYGRVEDYETLWGMGVNVSGTIALARYGKIYRGDIVQNAADAGAIGTIVYTDRKDYGGGGGDTKWFPADKWMPPSGVQVGTVYNSLGDPTTPGWPSTMSEACERLSEEDIEKTGDIPSIPSLPVSGSDGEEILRSIGGLVANDEWQGSEDAPVYRVGPGPGILNLSYIANKTIMEIQNVIGLIEGAEEPDRFVILGNHRDAWTFGAVDPNSGTASLLEVARRLGELQKKGWRPRRTIILCNWDAEEYALIGSTEWVEENREMLASRAVAYLNMDCAVSGPGFHASATPQLEELIKQASKEVQDPDNSTQSLYDSWVNSYNLSMFGRLGGGGSDYAPFVQHVGVPAADMFFGGGYPVYHSLYDDYLWMAEFGDPMFQRHVAAASIWGLVALRLADEEFLPFDYLSYADELEKSTEELEKELAGENIDLAPLYQSSDKLRRAAAKINGQKKELEDTKKWTTMWKANALKVREVNDRLMMAERALTDPDGLPGTPWYKHLIYGPMKHDDYGSKCFPGIEETVEKAWSLGSKEAWKAVQHQVWRVSRAINQASLVLSGELA